MSFCITASAQGAATLNGGTNVTVGENIEFTVNVSGCGEATSVAVAVDFADGFELVSADWLKNGSLKTFDKDTRKGALGALESTNVNGDLFKLVLKATVASANANNVSVNVIVKNGSNEIFNITPLKTVKINCATHSFSEFGKVDDNNHSRECTVCKIKETSSHSWNDGEVTKAATCKEEGAKLVTCTACKATKEEVIPVSTEHTFGDWKETKEATCTDAGIKERSCSTCAKLETAESEKALGHSFDNPQVIKEPTCTDAGIRGGKCTRCNQETTEAIKALGHKFDKYTVTKEPTCTEEGTKEGNCVTCGNKATEEIDALGHNYGEAVVTKEATETEDGIQTLTCSVCGDVKEEVIPATSKDVEDSSDETDTENEENEKIPTVGAEVDDIEPRNTNAIWIVIVITAIIIAAATLLLVRNRR